MQKRDLPDHPGFDRLMTAVLCRCSISSRMLRIETNQHVALTVAKTLHLVNDAIAYSQAKA
jgi:hypothetical protein